MQGIARKKYQDEVGQSLSRNVYLAAAEGQSFLPSSYGYRYALKYLAVSNLKL